VSERPIDDALAGILASCNTSILLETSTYCLAIPRNTFALQRHLMNATRSLIVIRRPAHVAVIRAISDIKHLSSDLRA
jgi:hypothetical protein